MTFTNADSLDHIANVYVQDGLKLRHLEFSIMDAGLKTHGDKKNEGAYRPIWGHAATAGWPYPPPTEWRCD